MWNLNNKVENTKDKVTGKAKEATEGPPEAKRWS